MKPRITFIYHVCLDWAVFSREGTFTYQGTFKGKMILKPYLKEYVGVVQEENKLSYYGEF